MPQDPLDIAAQRVVPGMQGDEGIVEIAPALAGAAFDQHQVVGREHGDPQRTQQFAGPAQRLAVDRHPCPAGDRHLGLDEKLPRPTQALGPHDRPLAPMAHEGVGRRAAK